MFWHSAQRSAVCAVGPPAGGRWRVFLHSWCDAGLSGYYFILALAKTPDKSGQAVTPGGSAPPERGRPVPPATEQSSLVRKFSRHRSQ